METLISFLTTLNSLSPLAIIALLALTLFWTIFKSPVKSIGSSIDEIKSNHLHQIPEIAANMEQIATGMDKSVEILQRIEIRMAEDFSWMRAKLEDK